ncbi:DsbA family protein [Lacticaseibacillus jixianensis]|uniref:DsbA family protein n=1 Tax=Lacticaseibacillus jixianensis TaxID=2486012 RepID=A0ABW4B7H1_9LACO|nr:DsbA family protein [Lacticaseibacillus jixianensis]
MLELFLFINPIGNRCREAELAVQRLARELTQKVSLRFVPLVNFPVIDQYMREAHLDPHNLALRNQLFNTAYQVAVDFKAAQFQGNVKARKLLIKQQAALATPAAPYDLKQAFEDVKQVGFDLEAFQEDRAREEMSQCLASDQAIALEMGITETPAVVVFNTANPTEGIRLGNVKTYERFKKVVQTVITQPDIQPSRALLRSLN